MNETVVFEWRYTSVSVLLRLAGVFIVGLGAACLWMGLITRQVGGYAWLFLGVLLAILGAACVKKSRNRPNARQVIVDGEGVRFIAEGRWIWGIPWKDIRAVGTKRKASIPDSDGTSIPGDIGIFLALDDGICKLRLGYDFGPGQTMVQLFRHLVRCAVERNIPVEDGLGWGPGAESLPRHGLNERLLSSGVLLPPANLDTGLYQDRWHNGKNYLSAGPIMAGAFGFMGFGLVITIFGISLGPLIPMVVLGLILTTIGLLFGLGFLIAVVRRVTVVAFNPGGLSVRGGLGRWISLRWEQVRRCRLDVDTRQLAIYSDLGKRTGVFDENVMLALCKMYTRATGRPAETWSSGAEACIGVPARNIN